MKEKQMVEGQTISAEKNSTVDAGQVEMENNINDMSAEQKKRMVFGVYFVLVLLGVATGYFLSHASTNMMETNQKPGWVKTGKVAGISDTKTFKDSAVGTIAKGGLDGEGTHQLTRDGGPSQTVYLTSSAVDMDEYVGKKVKVWGQTMAAKKAAWLMDVGKVELQ